MKCKICNEEINLSVFGMPNNICYGCFTEPEKKEVLNKNLKEVKIKKKLKSEKTNHTRKNLYKTLRWN